MLLVAFGGAIGFDWLGWLAALLAAIAAYIRLLGGTLGLPQDFRGPMAKPQRMAALTIGAVAAPFELWTTDSLVVPTLALALVVAGTAVTIGLRLWRQARALEHGAGMTSAPTGDAP